MTPQNGIKGRSDDGLTLNRMILLSLFLHSVVLSIVFFFLSPSLPSPKWTFGPVYTVNLVSFSENFMRQSSASAISGDFIEKSPSDHAIILKKQVETVPSVPGKKTENQRRDMSSIEKALENIRQRVSAADSTPAVKQNQTSDSEINTKMKMYYASIWARIKNQWALPQSIMPRESIEAVIDVKISRSGAVSDISFEKKSGNRYFDESAMKAVRKASPLPPLPEWIRDNSMEIGIRFHSSELR